MPRINRTRKSNIIINRSKMTKVKASLKLENGMEFHGYSFGYEGACSGEVVFSTAMAGYPESLTDPSYEGQILCLTYPIVGAYGVPAEGLDANGLSEYLESEKIHVKGLVVTDYSENFSHWNAVKSLGQWLQEQKIPAICGIDTRELTKVLRDKGSMQGVIRVEGQAAETAAATENPVAEVACTEVRTYGKGDKKVVLLDCGAKHSIIKGMIERGVEVEVVRVPWNHDFTAMEYDGVLISNGPGNPELCTETVANVKKAMEAGKAVLGIGLGHQILALAAGAKTYKLKSGHRGSNQPVRMEGSNRCFITTQNHGYAVCADSLPAGWKASFTNMNDGSNEGIRHDSKPFYGVQFHPEVAPGAGDKGFIIDEFISKL